MPRKSCQRFSSDELLTQLNFHDLCSKPLSEMALGVRSKGESRTEWRHDWAVPQRLATHCRLHGKCRCPITVAAGPRWDRVAPRTGAPGRRAVDEQSIRSERIGVAPV